jgi:hypothetical protein
MVMKKIMILIAAVLISASMQSQHVFNKGDVFLNLGIGAPYNYGYIPTINFSGEIGVIPTGDIGIVSFGGIAEMQFATYKYSNSSNSFVQFIIGPRAAWHVTAFESDEWDVYAVTGVGLWVKSKPYYDNGNYYKNSSIAPYGEFYVGGRWMFNPTTGLFSEVGYGPLSVFKFGVTFGF